jgi:hypothetical protein
MGFVEACGIVTLGLVGLAFACWYAWCWFTMLFVCQRPSGFFSLAYSTSSLFLMVNALGLIAGLALLLSHLTS